MHARNTDRVPRDPLHDPRIAAGKDHTVRHFADGYATPHQPRAYLHAPDHRDVAVERAFVARHSTDFHTRYARDMDVRERAIWRAGLWRNEWHYGRRGWWWEANGVWYPYGAPVFPYPEIVADQIVYDTPTVDGPDLSFVEGAPDEVASGPDAIAAGGATGGVIAQDVPPLPPAPAGWYRCDRPDGYYPTEAACSSDWDLVQNAPLPGE